MIIASHRAAVVMSHKANPPNGINNSILYDLYSMLYEWCGRQKMEYGEKCTRTYSKENRDYRDS